MVPRMILEIFSPELPRLFRILARTHSYMLMMSDAGPYRVYSIWLSDMVG